MGRRSKFFLVKFLYGQRGGFKEEEGFKGMEVSHKEDGEIRYAPVDTVKSSKKRGRKGGILRRRGTEVRKLKWDFEVFGT